MGGIVLSRPSQIRRIVAELRAALGPDVPAWELLQLAAKFVEAHREPDAFELDDAVLPRAFHARELDVAFSDGGWRVLEFERRAGMRFDD